MCCPVLGTQNFPPTASSSGSPQTGEPWSQWDAVDGSTCSTNCSYKRRTLSTFLPRVLAQAQFWYHLLLCVVAMRLPDTNTCELSEHIVGQIPPFAILPHRWGDDEVSYRDYVKRRVTKGNGFEKIIGFCNFAKSLREPHQWVWVDSCCIDKRNSSELTEAINSMYTWH